MIGGKRFPGHHADSRANRWPDPGRARGPEDRQV